MATVTTLIFFIILTGCSLVKSASYNSYAQPCPSYLRVFGKPNSYLATDGTGFFRDLLDAIAPLAGITYTLMLRPDLGYGSQLPNGTWDGLIGALVNNDADLAVADLSLTEAREDVADSLVPVEYTKLQLIAKASTGLTSSSNYIAEDSNDLWSLKNSKIAAQRAIYDNVNSNRPGSIVSGSSAAVPKMRTGDFVFLVESPSANRIMRNNPGEFKIVGSDLAVFYNTIWVQQGSCLREKLNKALLHISEDETLLGLQQKYNLIS